MPLTVLSVAFPFAPVTADPAGGAEQVLAQLDRTIVGAGHRSIVVAAEGSEVAGELRPVPSVKGEIDADALAAIHPAVRCRIEQAMGDADLLHLHGVDFARYLPDGGPVALATLHLPLGWYPGEALRPRRPRTWLQPVSADQASHAETAVQLLPPIENGVDTELYRPTAARSDHVLVLGRVAREKGFHDAIRAARLADVPLLAAGRIYPYAEHRRYFDEEVAPLLDARRRWLGPVAGAEKRRLIAAARCLLIPSTAPETSSLVAMEAAACGTPVVAYRSGALRHLVEDGVTGYLVDGVEAMAAAIGATQALDRRAIRDRACRRFSLRRTADAYLDLYARLAA